MNNPFDMPCLRVPQSYTASATTSVLGKGHLPIRKGRTPPVLRPLTKEEMQSLFKVRGIVDVKKAVQEITEDKEAAEIGKIIEVHGEVREVEGDVKEVGEDVKEVEEDVKEVGDDVKEVEEVGEDVKEVEDDVKEVGEDVKEVGEDVGEVGEDVKDENEYHDKVAKDEEFPSSRKVFNCMIEIIKKRGKMKGSLRFSKMEQFVDACSFGMVNKIVYSLYKKDFNVNDELLHGMSALQHACYTGQNEVVKLLLDLGANPNYQRKTDNFTPLMAAACYPGIETPKLLDCVRAVVEAGGVVNATNRNLYSALHFAVKRRHVQTVEYLLENGANLLQEDENGETPWHIVFDTKDVATLKVLSRHRFPNGERGDISC